MNLLLWTFIGELIGRLTPILIFLRLQFLLLILQNPSLILFLADVTLDAEHQQNLLPQLVKQLNVLSCGDDLVGNVHPLQDLGQSLVDLAR